MFYLVAHSGLWAGKNTIIILAVYAFIVFGLAVTIESQMDLNILLGQMNFFAKKISGTLFKCFCKIRNIKAVVLGFGGI